MSVENALLAVLAADPTVVGLVGSRIFEIQLPQRGSPPVVSTILPALTYRLIADVSVNAHDGPSGLARARVSFDCWAENPTDARAVANAVRLALTAPGATGTYGDVTITRAMKISELSDFQSDIKLRRRILDLAVWHSEEVAA